MTIEIINKNLRLDIHGFSGVAVNKDCVGTAFELMDKMWQAVKSNDLKSKGINIWRTNLMKACLPALNFTIQVVSTRVRKKTIDLPKYAYYEHVGSYCLLKQVGENMRTELKEMGFETTLPYIEMYGHWTKDETVLESELLMSLM